MNNVLGFPFIFRGALDVPRDAINDEMKVRGRARRWPTLAREDVPDAVARAYGVDALRFGPEYIIPKPFDPRVLLWVAPAVAEAAVEAGVARRHLDPEEYRQRLERPLGFERQFKRRVRCAPRARRGASCSPRASTTRSCAPATSSTRSGSRGRCCSGIRR